MGLTFSAVHDSYWTHAGTVDEMNVALRRAFVDLHEQPLLDDLRNSLCLQYPELELAPVPQLGSLDINAVLDSKYFFS